MHRSWCSCWLEGDSESELVHTAELAGVIDHWVKVMGRWVADVEHGEPGIADGEAVPGRELTATSE
jgi:hypothetical protein